MTSSALYEKRHEFGQDDVDIAGFHDIMLEIAPWAARKGRDPSTLFCFSVYSLREA